MTMTVSVERVGRQFRAAHAASDGVFRAGTVNDFKVQFVGLTLEIALRVVQQVQLFELFFDFIRSVTLHQVAQ